MSSIIPLANYHPNVESRLVSSYNSRESVVRIRSIQAGVHFD